MARGSVCTAPLCLLDDHCGQTLAAVPAVVVALVIGGMIVGTVEGLVVVVGVGFALVVMVIGVVGVGVVTGGGFGLVVAVVVVVEFGVVVVEVVAGLG